MELVLCRFREWLVEKKQREPIGVSWYIRDKKSSMAEVNKLEKVVEETDIPSICSWSKNNNIFR